MKICEPYEKIEVKTDGFNMSIIFHPMNPSFYLATIRKVEQISEDECPTIRNHTFLMTLNENFEIIDSKEMEEKITRDMYVSFTTGLEDCRLINKDYMIGVLLDSNSEWKPDTCLCKYEMTTGNILKMKYLGDGSVAQKNWLVLQETVNSFYVLHSYNPLKVISIDKDSGSQYMMHFQKVFNLEDCEMHGGGSVFLPYQKQYLVNVRIVRHHHYQYSLWLLFNEKYKLIGTSEPFRFFETQVERHYEVVMSLLEKNDTLLVSVSLNDKKNYVFKYDLNKVLNMIEIRDLIQS